MSGPPDVVFDSLPYVDQVHEDYEEYALALIEAEMKEAEPKPAAVPDLVFRTPLLRREYEARTKGSEFSPRDPKELQNVMDSTEDVLTFSSATRSGDPQKDVRRLRAQYEAERVRGVVLDVQKLGQSDVWKAHTADNGHHPGSVLDLHAGWSAAVEHQRVHVVEEINFRRQQYQQRQAGPELDELAERRRAALTAHHQWLGAVRNEKAKQQQSQQGTEEQKAMER